VIPSRRAIPKRERPEQVRLHCRLSAAGRADQPDEAVERDAGQEEAGSEDEQVPRTPDDERARRREQQKSVGLALPSRAGELVGGEDQDEQRCGATEQAHDAGAGVDRERAVERGLDAPHHAENGGDQTGHEGGDRDGATDPLTVARQKGPAHQRRESSGEEHHLREQQQWPHLRGVH